MRPQVDVFELECPVNRLRWLLGRCAGLYGELHAAASSKENLGPNEQEDEKILFSGLFDRLSVLIKCLNRRKE